MGRLSQLTAQLESRKAQALAQETEAQFTRDLSSQVAENLNETIVSTLKAVDLAPIITAIASEVPETDLSPLQKAIAEVYSGLRSTVMAECNRMIKAIPKPAEQIPTDLEPVLSGLQWIKSFLALKPDLQIPDQRIVTRMDVIRNNAGFIQSIEVEYKE